MIQPNSRRTTSGRECLFSLLDFDPNAIDTDVSIPTFTVPVDSCNEEYIANVNKVIQTIGDSDSDVTPEMITTTLSSPETSTDSSVVPIPTEVLQQLVEDYKKVAEDNSSLHTALEDLQHMNCDLVLFAQRLLQQVSSFSSTISVPSRSDPASASLDADVKAYVETLSQAVRRHTLDSTSKCYEKDCIGCKAVQHIIQTPMPVLVTPVPAISPATSLATDTDGVVIASYGTDAKPNVLDSTSASIAREWESIIAKEQDVTAIKSAAQNRVANSVFTRAPTEKATSSTSRRIQLFLWFVLMVSVVFKMLYGTSVWNSFDAT